MQSQIFALRRTLTWSSLPLAYLTAGPLADRIFEPLLSVGGLLAGSIGQVIGTGPGRGIGLLYIVMGILNLLVIVISYRYPPIRFVEDELPDSV